MTTSIDSLMKDLARLKRADDAAQTKAKATAAAYDAARLALLGALNAAKLEGARSGSVRAEVYSQEVFNVTDWDAFYAQRDAKHLLQKRLSTAAVRERLAAGKRLPWLKTDKVRKLRVTVEK